MEDIEVVLVSTKCFQEYLLLNIDQLKLLGYKVTVITDQCFFDRFVDCYSFVNVVASEDLVCDFDSKSKLDKTFRGGFWNNCSKRLFLLYEYMKKYNRCHVIHLENDVLLYTMKTKFLAFNLDLNKMYVTIDAKNRCIPGIVYIPNHIVLQKLIDNYIFDKDDMHNMYIFYEQNQNICNTFPIIDTSFDEGIYNKNYKDFMSIFDAAAMGQYLGGIDPRNSDVADTKGFVNETCVVKYNNYEFIWKDHDSLYRLPYLVGHNNAHIPINNLHIHSKKIEDFVIYLFDIVIPVGPHDRHVLEQQIEYTKKNIMGYRNIYLICYDPTIRIDGTITICEDVFPFSKKSICDIFGNESRSGWYLQQLLKLYAGFCVPNIMNKYLVIDCDTFFLKPTRFIEPETGKCLYNHGSEHHGYYFDHMKKLDSGFERSMDRSGICHHMIFETRFIREIMDIVELNHGDKFHRMFVKLLPNISITESGASEYELYFHYIMKYRKDEVILRPLNWDNVDRLDLLKSNSGNKDYISYHWYSR